MKETFYFPHDNNAHNDPKIMSLFMGIGLAGIGLYWIIIEIMHQQENGMISEEQFEDYINWYCMRETSNGTDFVKQMLSKFKASGLFYFEDKKVYSKRVLKNKEFREDLSKKRSEAGKKGAKIRLSNTQNQANAKQNLTNVKQLNKNKIKINKRKDIKNISKDIGKKELITTKVVTLQELIKKEFTQEFLNEVYAKYNLSKQDFIESSEEFVEYWNSQHLGKGKLRWEKEKTFDVKLRYRTWIRNSSKWNKALKNNKNVGITSI